MKSLQSRPHVRGPGRPEDTTTLSRARVFLAVLVPADLATGRGLPGEHLGWDVARDRGHPSARVDTAKPLATKQGRLLRTCARCLWYTAGGQPSTHVAPAPRAQRPVPGFPQPPDLFPTPFYTRDHLSTF